jgi:4-hydroxy-tetrahydrodipicolinate synthase
MEEKNMICGVYTAVLTPLNKNRSIDFRLLIDHCKWLLENGCNGLTLLGTTGEANSFSLKERLQYLRKIAASDLPLENIIIGTGSCSVPETTVLSKESIECGFGGQLVLPPFYYKPVMDDGLFAYFSELIKEIKEDRLRIYLYHIPRLTGIDFSMHLLGRLQEAFPVLIAGIKDSGGEWNHTEAILQTFPALEVFAGSERFLLYTLRAGGMGCISATTNLTSQLAGEVYEQFLSGGGMENQQSLTKIREVMEGFPFIPALKFLMSETTGIEQWRFMRPPNSPLTRDQEKKLIERLKAVEFPIPKLS